MTTETYTLNGQTDFEFNRPVRVGTELTVEVVPGGVVSPASYEVIGAGPGATGVTVRYPTAPADGTKTLKITRQAELQRLSDFTGAAGINATGLEKEFNNLYRALRDLVLRQTLKAPVKVATDSNITLSGEQTVNGVPVTDGDRVLVTSQTDDTENGIYNVSTAAWTRTPDADDAEDIVNGTLVLDENSGNLYTFELSGDFDPGNSSVTFVETAFDQIVADARAWAENPEDDEVEPGEFSAYHWAQKSKNNSSSIASVDTLSGLKAVDTAAFTTIILSGTAREGVFHFDNSDLSTEVGNDPQEGIYVAPDSDVTGASGAWVRRVPRDKITFEMFGATGDGETDDTDAIQAALNEPSGYNVVSDQPGVTYKTTATLFNQIENRVVNFKGSTIENTNNSRYAIVTVSAALATQTDSALDAFAAEYHFSDQIFNSHVINVRTTMSPNTSGGTNLGFGILYGDSCFIRHFVVESTNGNAVQLQGCTDCLTQFGEIGGHRNYGAFYYQCKNTVVDALSIAGGTRGIVVKHAYLPSTARNDAITRCTIKGVSERGITGGASAGTGSSPELEPEDHEIVRGVKIEGCVLITESGASSICNIEPGRHADQWTIENNQFSGPGLSESFVDVVIRVAGEGDTSEYLGSGHKVSRNKIAGFKTTDAIITVDTSCMIDAENSFENCESQSLIVFGDNHSGGPASFSNNWIKNCILQGGAGGIGGFVSTTANHPWLKVHDNNAKFSVVENEGTVTRTTAFFVRTNDDGARPSIKNNHVEITVDDAAIDTVNAVSAEHGATENNEIIIISTVDDLLVRGINSPNLSSIIVGNLLDFRDNAASGTTDATAIRAASSAVTSPNLFLGDWDGEVITV